MSYEYKFAPVMSTHDIVMDSKERLMLRTDDLRQYWQGGPRLSYTSDGTPRIRADKINEDAYMGHLEGTAYIGVAFMPNEILIEAYYPYSAQKSHIWYSYNEETKVATKHKETIDTEGYSELPMPPTEIESEQNANDISWYLRVLAYDLVPTFEWQHNDDLERQKLRGKEPFMFELEQLR